MYSRDRLIKAIDNSACLTRRQIDDYLQNKLFPEELYVVEMHLNECPFCNDAVEGYTQAGNANQLLSTVEEFSFTPVTASAIQPDAVPPAPKTPEIKVPETKVAPATPPSAEKIKEVRKVPPAQPVRKVTFDNEPRRNRKLLPLGIAAAVLLGLGIWGISRIGNDKNADNMLADNGSAASGEQIEDGMFNESSINREEDSVMNAKYGFQNQRPMAGGHYARQPGYTGDGQMTDSTSVAMMADATGEQSSPAVARAEERSGSFVGPVLPREEEQRRTAATAPANADRAKAATVANTAKTKTETAKTADKAVAANSKDAKNKNTASPAANARVAAAKETAKPAESKAPANSPALTQADKDYKKGLELYNKKQYSASIMYFQSAAKIKDYPNRTKAESYIKLAKSEVVNAERKKNSEKNNDK